MAFHMKSVRAAGAGTPLDPFIGTENYNDSADIWSLGIAAIGTCIGKPPLSNSKPTQVLFMIPKNDPHTIPEDYIDDFSDGFIAFIAKCLTENAAARPTASRRSSYGKQMNGMHNLHGGEGINVMDREGDGLDRKGSGSESTYTYVYRESRKNMDRHGQSRHATQGPRAR
eukprot:228425_1